MSSVLKSSRRPYKRSFVDSNILLPAIKPVLPSFQTPQQPACHLLPFGRGSAFWKIWLALLLHTLFTALVVYLHMCGPAPWQGNLAIPQAMLKVFRVTILIGFVLSYRVMTRVYDRYWMGRTSWDDVIRNSRTMGRLIWFHVPPYLSPKIPGEEKSSSEMLAIMAEKRMALDLLVGFAVALKHHLRGEVGIYYEDLYDLVRPLHDHVSDAQDDALGQINQPHSPLDISKWIRSNPSERLQSRTSDPMKSRDAAQRRIWSPPLQPRIGPAKQHPSVFTGGENLPLEILRCLSEWFSVLEARGTTSAISSMISLISSMEETLSALERILTTPLPFIYLVHIRHTIWIYLLSLPFQLVGIFGWYTIPGVIIATFIHLDFLAARDETAQPFGYDENDLDLDLFCREIVRVDVENLKKSPCLNAYFSDAQAKSLGLKSNVYIHNNQDSGHIV